MVSFDPKAIDVILASARSSFGPKRADNPDQQQKIAAEPLVTDINREEVKARLEASEARVAAQMTEARAEATQLRSDVREGLAQIKSQGDVAKANADQFYADARTMMAESRTIMAESRTLLSEIRLAGEQNKTAVMGMGYKVGTWVFGALVALGGLYFTIKKAVSTPDGQISAAQAAPRSPIESAKP